MISEKDAISKLIDMDNFLADITSTLLLPSGTACRLAYQNLQTYLNYFNGSELIIPQTEKVTRWVKRKARNSFMEEWSESDKKLNLAIAKATVEAGLGDGNNLLNEDLAGCFVRFFIDNYYRKLQFVDVLDIGSGKGDTTIAIADEVSGYLADLIETEKEDYPDIDFYLIEPGDKRLLAFEEEWGKTYQGDPRFDYQYAKATDEKQFSKFGENIFDFVVSNVVFHHMTYPDHFSHIRRVLREDGFLIFGDWYTSMWSHPAFLIPLLRDLGASDKTIGRYRSAFHLSETASDDIYQQMGEKEKNAFKQMKKYIVALGIEFQELLKEWDLGNKEEEGEKKKRPVLYFFEAHEKRSERIQKIERGGFQLVDITETFPKSGEFASVIVAKPRPDRLNGDNDSDKDDMFSAKASLPRKQSSGVNRKTGEKAFRPPKKAVPETKKPLRKKAVV